MGGRGATRSHSFHLLLAEGIQARQATAGGRWKKPPGWVFLGHLEKTMKTEGNKNFPVVLRWYPREFPGYQGIDD